MKKCLMLLIPQAIKYVLHWGKNFVILKCKYWEQVDGKSILGNN